MDPNGHIYYDANGVSQEDSERLEEELRKASEDDLARFQAEMEAARDAFDAKARGDA